MNRDVLRTIRECHQPKSQPSKTIFIDSPTPFFEALFPRLKHTFYLDVDPREAHRRVRANRSETEMFETLGELMRIAEKTQAMARYNGWNIVDANSPEEEIEMDIWDVLLSS